MEIKWKEAEGRPPAWNAIRTTIKRSMSQRKLAKYSFIVQEEEEEEEEEEEVEDSPLFNSDIFSIVAYRWWRLWWISTPHDHPLTSTSIADKSLPPFPPFPPFPLFILSGISYFRIQMIELLNCVQLKNANYPRNLRKIARKS